MNAKKDFRLPFNGYVLLRSYSTTVRNTVSKCGHWSPYLKKDIDDRVH